MTSVCIIIIIIMLPQYIVLLIFMLTDSRGCLRHGVTLWCREYCVYDPCKNVILPIKPLEMRARDFVQYIYFKLKVVSFYEVSLFGK